MTFIASMRIYSLILRQNFNILTLRSELRDFIQYSLMVKPEQVRAAARGEINLPTMSCCANLDRKFC